MSNGRGSALQNQPYRERCTVHLVCDMHLDSTLNQVSGVVLEHLILVKILGWDPICICIYERLRISQASLQKDAGPPVHMAGYKERTAVWCWRR